MREARLKEPNTQGEVRELHKILRSDPQRYLQIVNGWIAENPRNAQAYFNRHSAWMSLGQPRLALEDMDRVVALDPKPVDLQSRGDIHRHLGEHAKALDDYDRAEAMNPAKWEDDAFGLLSQADSHARLGELARALACCARLPDDFWTPGLNGAPAGGKADIANALRLTAARSAGGQ